MEDLLSDERVERIADSLRLRFPNRLDESSFVSFIQPVTTVPVQTPAGIHIDMPVPAQCVFAIISPDPRPWKSAAEGILTAATVTLADWLDTERIKSHYVTGNDDPAYKPFLMATLEQLHKLQSASEQINNSN